MDSGQFKVVYATPELLLDKAGHFAKRTIRQKTAFIKNLVAVAVDECHLCWDWQSFRSQYRFIGNLRLTLTNVPFICLSATLTANVAAYVHEACRLRFPTARISISTRRDNVNLVVARIDGSGYEELEDLISEEVLRARVDIDCCGLPCP